MNDDFEKGFISKEELLKYVSEEEIFSLVFGFKPKEYQYVTSPFRKDIKPGCYFEACPSGRLRFIDFANSNIINGVRMSNIDCFNAVQIYYKLPNFYKTLEFIKEKLIDNKPVKRNIRVAKPIIKKKEVKILIEPRMFDARDRQFWQPYGISKQNLIDDRVFAVKSFKIVNSMTGTTIKRVYDPCYCYSDFNDGRKKLYRPYNKSYKFTTNCKPDDVGQINNLPEFGRLLVISKSYKDCRVLRNEGYNCVWFQNEGMIPSDDILIDLCNRFNKITVFFDNDEAGMKASIKVVDKINSLYSGKCNGIHLPQQLLSKDITDPSDLLKAQGIGSLKKFLYNNL